MTSTADDAETEADKAYWRAEIEHMRAETAKWRADKVKAEKAAKWYPLAAFVILILGSAWIVGLLIVVAKVIRL